MSMQNWRVTGANRESGEDQTITVEAANEAQATRRAVRRGLVVSGAVPEDATVTIEEDDYDLEPDEAPPRPSSPPRRLNGDDDGLEQLALAGRSTPRPLRRSLGFPGTVMTISAWACVGLGILFCAYAGYQLVMAAVDGIGAATAAAPPAQPDPNNPFAGLGAELQRSGRQFVAWTRVILAATAAGPGAALALLGSSGLVALQRLR